MPRRFLLVGLMLIATTAANAQSPTCEKLASLNLPNTTITLAKREPAGQLPEFCRIAATLKPSSDSDIKIEVWLPAAWNGKFQAVGNGAFNGAISTPAMGTALLDGYATASTDTGHTGNTASFGLGHPEKVIDFGWRAVHEMTVTAKKLVETYYGTAPKFSYFVGCSAGGRQAMKEAQRFPSDFNGIVAGAPGLDWTGRASQAVRVSQALQKNEAARMTATATGLLHAAALNSCDAADGLKDGLISEPASCAFDPGVLQCKGAASGSCLSSAQVEAAKLLYASSQQPGSELGWTDLGWTASARATGLEQFRYLVFKDPSWDIPQFNFARDSVRAEELDNNTINALDPNLKPFFDAGGKLIQYHGWSDPQISPVASTTYYQRAVGKSADHYRLFMAPGMGHCGGGEGPNTFDVVGALEQWVEQGKAPDRIIASTDARTRPLCPYPQVAKYIGTGSIDDAANFTCKLP